jgi:hypothetical protein
MPIYTEDIQDTDLQDTDCAETPDCAERSDCAETPDAFTPDTAEKADWVLGKIAAARAAAARIRLNAELMAREQEREAEGLEWRFGAALQTWLQAELLGGRKKSVRLYNGVLGYRTKPAGVHVTDPAAALSWARESLPGAVVEALDKKVLAAALLETGEALPWASFTPAEDVFYIK